VVCAALLEAVIEHSPDNAYLKMSAIYVYYQLDALSRSWKYYQTMGIKHVQLDSCTFTILPYLLRGGLYNEAIEVCNALLRFQISTARDCGDYAGRAMGNGVMGKANEFLVFQREKMLKSLSALDAKGVILDCAALLATPVPGNKLDEGPVFKGGLGVLQGIVGGDDDMMRATQMIVEAHNPSAALSLVSWADHGGSVNDCNSMADNRDLTIHCQQILLQTPPLSKEEIARDALRRGHVHSMLIRATLCLDSAKGPKKGKIVKSSEELEKRTKSLLDCIAAFDNFLEEHSLQDGAEGGCCKAVLEAALDLCHTLAVINSGLPSADTTDSMEQREQRACDLLETKAAPKLKQATSSITFSVKIVCSVLPNFIVPLYAVFRMCANSNDIYGWGKRKHKTKPCAKALQQVAIEFQGLIAKMISSLAR
jgi:hypothetical protein